MPGGRDSISEVCLHLALDLFNRPSYVLPLDSLIALSTLGVNVIC